MKKCSTNLVGELVWYDTLVTDEIALEHVWFLAATQEHVDYHIKSSLEAAETFQVSVGKGITTTQEFRRLLKITF
jgi:hypothetical protein